MKKIFFTTSLILFFTISFLIIILSTKGYETNKFNKFISEKIIENNKDISLKLKRIKFKFGIKDGSLFLETHNPELNYKNLNIPIENVKVYLDFISLIKSRPKIDKINLLSEEIDINQLKKIIIKTKPSNFNSIINNRLTKGKLVTNLELYFNDNLQLNNFIAKGEVKEMNVIVNNNLILRDTSFNFFTDNSDSLIKNINSKMDGFLIKNGDLKIERDKNLIIKSNFYTDVDLNDQNIKNYSKYLKNINYLNKKANFKASLNHNFNINFDKTYKVTDFSIKSTGRLNELKFRLNRPIKNTFLENDISSLSFKDSDLSIRYGLDKKNYINAVGIYQINDSKYHNFDFKNNFFNNESNMKVDFEFDQPLDINLINYKKDRDIKAKISSRFDVRKNLIHFKEINYFENKNLIIFEDLKISKKKLVSLQKIKVKTFKENNLNNDFSLNFSKNIDIKGKKYDASNLNKILKQKTKNNYLSNINKNIEIDLENIETPLSKKLLNFKLIGSVKKGKFVKISSKGDFGGNKFLDISLKSDKKNNKKFLEIYSDLPQPLLSEYKFFKGLSGGVLIFSSILENDSSISKLTIENFKVINAPGVVKLLSLADFGGLADLAEGEGLSFEKLEIQMNNSKGFLKLDEFYAVGPSISVLMDGYQDANGLTSLRGTLVPAKNLNKILSKIPVIGNIIIPKDVGEGLFGVSFKMKGLPGKIKTTINPIKTLTPRFITKALEKSRQSK